MHRIFPRRALDGYPERDNEYVPDRLGNLTVFKRLGYTLESLGLADEAMIEACRSRISGSVGRLDPSRPAAGPTDKRWGLRINVRLES